MSGFRVSVRLAVLAVGLVIGLVTDLATGDSCISVPSTGLVKRRPIAWIFRSAATTPI
jgi:hypothetical protein